MDDYELKYGVSEKELTKRLIGKDFGKDKDKPKFWKSLKTNKEYEFEIYNRIGSILTLPCDEYPFTIIY